MSRQKGRRVSPPTAAIVARRDQRTEASSNATTLASLAMLRVRTDLAQQQDYVDYLLPFVKHVLRDVGTDPVTGVQVKALINGEFGLHIPVQVVELVLKRLARPPYSVLRKLTHQWHVVDPSNLGDISGTRSAALRDTKHLVSQIAAFASSRFGLDWTQELATDSLLAYLSQFSIDCLAAFERNTALPCIPAAGSESLYVVSAFFQECIEGNPQMLERFMIVVKGNMLANALLCPDLESIQQKFDGTTFYLDTPLILRLISLDNDPRRDGVIDLINLLKNLKGRVAVFQHTVDEVRGVLDYYEANINNPRIQHYRMVAVREAGTKVSDIRLICEKLEDELRSLGIDCDHPVPYLRDYQIDEALLAKVLYDDIPYRNERGRDFDLNSLRSIYTLREGKRPRRLEECVAILVTSNVLLVKTAYEFGKENESTREVSSAVTDFTVANVAWLKSPVQHDRVPFAEMVAASYAAMNPSEALWEKMVAMAEHLLETSQFSLRDHELLRSSPIVRRELMNLTLGSEAAFTPETAEEVLHRIRAELVQETEDRFEMRRAEDADRQEAALEAQRRLNAQQQQELDETRRRQEADEAEKKRLLAAEQSRHRRLFNWAVLAGSTAGIATAVLLGLAVVGGLLLPIVAFFLNAPDERTKWVVGALTISALVLAAIWGIPSSLWGVNVFALSDLMKTRTRRRMYRALTRLAFGEVLEDKNVLIMEQSRDEGKAAGAKTGAIRN